MGGNSNSLDNQAITKIDCTYVISNSKVENFSIVGALNYANLDFERNKLNVVSLLINLHR